MTRQKATAIHLGLSALIGAIVCAVMLFVWYPGPLFNASGGQSLVAILIAVDVVVGPLITFIIFNPTKARHLLRLDLAFIGLVQFAALAYGVYVISQARPAYIVFTVDRFDLVAVQELTAKARAEAKRPEFRELPLGRPATIGAIPPIDGNEQMDVITSAASGGRDVQHFPRYYVPYAEVARQAAARARPIKVLRDRLSKGDALELDRAIAATGFAEADLRFLPLDGRAADYVVLLDAKTGDVRGYAAVDPW